MMKSAVSIGSLIALVVCVTLPANSPPAHANFITEGGVTCSTTASNTVCANDNSELTWYEELGPRMSTAVLDTLYNSYDTTRLTVQVASGHNGEMDVFYSFVNLQGLIGQHRCITKATTNRCDHAHVDFDPNELDGQSDTFLKASACHETGHSVGLTHGMDGRPQLSNNDPVLHCMRLPSNPNTTVGSHNVAHLNGLY